VRLLVLGPSGQVGRELGRLTWPQQTVIVQIGRDGCDLRNLSSIAPAVEAARPDIVINAAAYTAVDRAESEADLALTVNGHAPREIARACERTGASLIHLSTDYVFDGAKPGAYLESDAVNPLSVYGRSKAAGEAGIRAVLERHIIVRTSWVFSSHGANFVKTMLGLGTRPSLRIVADQTGGPTSAGDIAQMLLSLAVAVDGGQNCWGTFHFASADPTSWHGFAQAIFAGARLENTPDLVPITSAEYPSPARRPANSVLDCALIRRTFGIAQPSWRVALAKVLDELRPSRGDH
jgi:dTDP-4-dehydrorhamnose reductase